MRAKQRDRAMMKRKGLLKELADVSAGEYKLEDLAGILSGERRSPKVVKDNALKELKELEEVLLELAALCAQIGEGLIGVEDVRRLTK